ncbi:MULTISPECIES: lysozyme [Burkholderia]|uniref:lysozyme n=1 Tax=Burkholderia TaxID=32008 RepID=UPI0005521D6C|nr:MULTISPECIES: lysozyme [Burkholderia]KVF95419.1 glycosyl hydrolase [Burkholderia vietnamiensis]KVR83025.1 glycosyl hydrolase [Burkholderia vietnamiensis]KVR93331.1 glycosyl hydrolase [Burkholderia vietnamiensis]KVR95631.1 glycosyl hydrolase [Burkholderia vietnamiensis]KVS32672.1 glycosyl hydrolase [Burkholderia vietnamiensis]
MASAPKKTLAGVVGAAAAALLLSIVPRFEGQVLVAKPDPIGIVTACNGDTKDVKLGQRFTPEECRTRLEQRLIEHAEPVLKCTPTLKGHPYQLAAAVSFAYNVGPRAYCASTTARRFNAGDFRGACRAMNESDSGRPQWVTAGGRVLPGLVKRRADERALCERGL